MIVSLNVSVRPFVQHEGAV